MSVSEQESGIAQNHIRQIENLVKHENCFLLVRPTEHDSTQLIKSGFPTKSMDIHDKSSNWGPMAGMVPLDPALNKRRIGLPDMEISLGAFASGAAVSMPLRYSRNVLNSLFSRNKINLIDDYYLVHPPGRPPMVRRCVAGEAGVHPGRDSCCVICPNDPRATKFAILIEGNHASVYWVKFPIGNEDFGSLIPVYVWAYNIGGWPMPVTGDYDLWMVAPYYTQVQQHSRVIQHNTVHGQSSATQYITNLIGRLNHVCNRDINPVFQHGAEAQNENFTQTLDERLVLFTPGGQSRMIEKVEYVAILKEMLSCGYLVCGNPQYRNEDPVIGGAHWATNESLLESLSRIDQDFYDEMRRASADMSRRRSSAEEHGRRLSSIEDRRSIAKDRRKGVHDIKAMDNTFQSILTTPTPITHLQEVDFPSDYCIFEQGEIVFLASMCDKISRSMGLTDREIRQLTMRLDQAKQDLTQSYANGSKARLGTWL